MIDGRPEEYRGPISPEMAARGMNLARKNAKRLAADAQLLLDAGRAPTAAALAALSIEEAGKVSILRGLVLASSEEQLRAEWKRYRDHRSKNGAWILPDLVAKGARRLAELAPLVERGAEHTNLLNSIKQLGLYSDCYGPTGHWADPVEVVEKALAENLVQTATAMASVGNDVTLRELELWKQHLGPVWGTPEMPHALVRWAAAMHVEGLSDTLANEFASFVYGEARGTPWTEPKQH